MEIGTKSEDLPLRVSAIQAFISFRDSTFDDIFVFCFVAKEVQDKLQKLIIDLRESPIVRLVSSEVLATVIGDSQSCHECFSSFLNCHRTRIDQATGWFSSSCHTYATSPNARDIPQSGTRGRKDSRNWYVFIDLLWTIMEYILFFARLEILL